MNHSKQDNLEIETRSIINESVFCGRLDLVVNHASTHTYCLVLNGMVVITPLGILCTPRHNNVYVTMVIVNVG